MMGRTLRPALHLAALAGAAGCVWALAPAISAKPYIPGAKDFEQRLSGVQRLADAAADPLRGAAQRAAEGEDEGPVTHRSGVIEAPARFDAAGIAGELRHYELRAREHGEGWSEWVEIANGDPVWFGGADQLQVRTRGWRPTGTLHYVNVSGDATPTDAALTAARRAVSTMSVAVAGILGSEVASADPPRPAVVRRSEWGANLRRGGCPPRRSPSKGQVRAAVVHHTVSSNSYSKADAPGMVLAICRYHRNANGWNDIGYNALVDRFGTLYEGRAGGLGRAVIGAHTEGFNTYTTGLSSLGTHTEVPLPRPAFRAAVKFLAWKLVRQGTTAKGRTTLLSAGGSTNRYPEGARVRTKRIVGHRRLSRTACPGDALNGQLVRLRNRVRARIAKYAAPDDGGKKPPEGGEAPPPDGGDTGGVPR